MAKITRDDMLQRIEAHRRIGGESKQVMRRMADESEMEVHQGIRRGAPEVSRRIPMMRQTGKSGERLDVAGPRSGDLISMKDVSETGTTMIPRQYREPKERVMKKEKVMTQDIKHVIKKTKVPTAREIEHDTEMTELGEREVDVPDLLKPTVNRAGIQKMDVITSSKPKVQGEPGIRLWKELKVGEHIPYSDVPARLAIHPQPIKETYVKQSDVIKTKAKKHGSVSGRTMVVSDDMVYEKESVVTAPTKAKRAPSAYNEFVSEKRREGYTMAEIGQMWRSR